MLRCHYSMSDGELGTRQQKETARCSKCKLYRFDHDAGEWKERGVGQVRLLENKENSRIRLLHRQEKTLKIRANHICELQIPEFSGRHLST